MTAGKDTLLDRFGRFLAGRLEVESSGYEPYTPSDPDTLRRVLQPGDILLIEGNQRISAAIKYLTQSTWSHSALYVGDALPEPDLVYSRAPLWKAGTVRTWGMRTGRMLPDGTPVRSKPPGRPRNKPGDPSWEAHQQQRRQKPSRRS